MVPLFLRGGIEEDDFGEIKDFNVGHQSLDERDPDISLSSMLLWKDDFGSIINRVTVPKFVQRRGEFVGFALRKIIFSFSDIMLYSRSNPRRVQGPNCDTFVGNTFLSQGQYFICYIKAA